MKKEYEYHFNTIFIENSSEIHFNSSISCIVDIRRVKFNSGINNIISSTVRTKIHFLEVFHCICYLQGPEIYEITHICNQGQLFISKFDFITLKSISIPYIRFCNSSEFISIDEYYHSSECQINLYFLEGKITEERIVHKNYTIFKGISLNSTFFVPNFKFECKNVFIISHIYIVNDIDTILIVERICSPDGWSVFYNITRDFEEVELSNSGTICISSTNIVRNLTICIHGECVNFMIMTYMI